MSSPAPPRARRSAAAATRERLLEAGRRAFAAKGLAGTNLKDDVLVPADVSVGSFYHQFRDKTELLLAILQEHASAFRARLSLLHTPSAGRTFESIAHDSFAMCFDLAERHGDLVRIHLRERASDDLRVRRYLREDRERWLASLAGDYRRLADAAGVALDTELAAELVVALALATVAQYLELPKARRPGARERLLDGLVRFTLAGVAGLAAPSPASAKESSR